MNTDPVQEYHWLVDRIRNRDPRRAEYLEALNRLLDDKSSLRQIVKHARKELKSWVYKYVFIHKRTSKFGSVFAIIPDPTWHFYDVRVRREGPRLVADICQKRSIYCKGRSIEVASFDPLALRERVRVAILYVFGEVIAAPIPDIVREGEYYLVGN